MLISYPEAGREYHIFFSGTVVDGPCTLLFPFYVDVIVSVIYIVYALLHKLFLVTVMLSACIKESAFEFVEFKLLSQ